MSRGCYILDESGQPVPEFDTLKWARWFEENARQVAITDVDGVRISTVFLGIDHNFGDRGAPVLWETMIFGGPCDGHQERYSSLAAAQSGHGRAVVLAMTAQEVTS